MTTRIGMALAAVAVVAVRVAAEEPAAMPTMQEKMSYTFGFDMGKTLSRQGVPIETNLVLQGFRDGLLRAKPALSDSDMAAALAACQAALKARQIEWRQNASAARRQAGAAAAAANATNALDVAGPNTLPDGAMSGGYDQTLTATGGRAPYLWSVSAGALPPGIVLAAGSGRISGTPTAPGTFTFTVQVRDAPGGIAEKPFRITVR